METSKIETVNGGLIAKKMIEILQRISAIGKDQRNSHQNFSFRGIDQIYDELNPIFKDVGVVILPEVIDRQVQERKSKKGDPIIHTWVRVRFVFMAEDGSTVTATMDGEGMDHGDKSTPKAMSIAMKYALFETFLIPVKGLDDPDKDSFEVGETPSTQSDQSDGTFDARSATTGKKVKVEDLVPHVDKTREEWREYSIPFGRLKGQTLADVVDSMVDQDETLENLAWLRDAMIKKFNPLGQFAENNTHSINCVRAAIALIEGSASSEGNPY